MNNKELESLIERAPGIVARMKKQHEGPETFEEALVVIALANIAEQKFWRDTCILMAILSVALVALL